MAQPAATSALLPLPRPGTPPFDIPFSKGELKPWIARATAKILTELIARNDAAGALDPNSQNSIFHALQPPSIGLASYMDRIVKYANCSDECFVCALIYIDRIIQTRTSFVISSFNIHRLLITSVMLSAKFMDDIYYNNAYYAKVGGVPTGEINGLELEFLFLINFTLFVQEDIFSMYKQELQKQAQEMMDADGTGGAGPVEGQ